MDIVFKQKVTTVATEAIKQNIGDRKAVNQEDTKE